MLTPEEFANRVSAAASGAGLAVDVLDEHRIKDLKMELLLGVARGSAVPARLVVIRHEPKGAPATPVIGLIGKGVTFDTGGVSIKPADGMERMKSDMSGGAAVAGAMLALARLGGPFRTIGIIPLAENMVGGRAIRPGDVLRGASGKTVEVINTDAEGRLHPGGRAVVRAPARVHAPHRRGHADRRLFRCARTACLGLDGRPDPVG